MLEFEPIELVYFVLVIVALGFALFFFIVSLAVCCSYMRSGFEVTNTEDTLATNETTCDGPQIISVVSTDPLSFDNSTDSREYKTYLSTPNYNRFAVEDPPPKYDQIFSSKFNTFY
ncbi:unnamed protein product [Orchesella dallaii]|uniref:Uncharacterized protein n=2 Tax=Orchesella TaxID=48705 RepID=A0A1D2MYJ6_ORCCI|nr:hypothetical protein Ocin01_08549 [Orchesella cincta]